MSTMIPKPFEEVKFSCSAKQELHSSCLSQYNNKYGGSDGRSCYSLLLLCCYLNIGITLMYFFKSFTHAKTIFTFQAIFFMRTFLHICIVRIQIYNLWMIAFLLHQSGTRICGNVLALNIKQTLSFIYNLILKCIYLFIKFVSLLFITCLLLLNSVNDLESDKDSILIKSIIIIITSTTTQVQEIKKASGIK